MLSISDAIKQFQLFLDNTPSLSIIITELQNLSDPAKDLETTIINLRKALKLFRKSFDERKNANGTVVSLANTVYLTLLNLAELKPINTDDPITFEPIYPDDSVYVSTGHQFSITSLVTYHNSRKAQEQFNDSEENKYLVNVSTNTVFDAFDIHHIIAKAKAKSLEFKNLKKPPEFRIQAVAQVTTPSSTPMSSSGSSASYSLFSRSNAMQRELTIWQMMTLKELQDFGLTSEHLKLLPKSYISSDHITFHHALIHLMTKRGIFSHTADSAMAELNDLTPLQARALSDGLDREDVINLTDQWQINAIIALRHLNITNWHIRKCINSNYDNKYYHDALIYIMTKSNYNWTPDEAARFVSTLTPLEAYGVANGLSREEVSHLIDRDQIDLYRDFRDEGLTIALLQQCPWDSRYDNKIVEHFVDRNNVRITSTYVLEKTNYFHDALRTLLLGFHLPNKMTAELAVQELQGLTNEQAKLIAHQHKTKAQILSSFDNPQQRCPF